MKNLNKFATFLAVSVLLTACGTTKKQPKITVEDAKGVAEQIYNAMEDPFPFECPDQCTVVYEMSSKESIKSENEEHSFLYSQKNKVTYSKAKNMYYSESTATFQEDKESETEVIRSWYFMEDDKIHCYSVAEEGEEKDYRHDSSGETTLDKFASESFLETNASFVRNFLEDVEFSEETPDFEGVPEGAKVTYTTYYGSKNEKSIEAEEKLNIVADDFVPEDAEKHWKGTESVSSEIKIEDYILKSFRGYEGFDMSTLDGSETESSAYEVKYTFSNKYETAPKLDKTLWKNN